VQVQTSVPRCIPHLGKPPAFGVWVVGSVICSPPGLRMTSPGPLQRRVGRPAEQEASSTRATQAAVKALLREVFKLN